VPVGETLSVRVSRGGAEMFRLLANRMQDSGATLSAQKPRSAKQKPQTPEIHIDANPFAAHSLSRSLSHSPTTSLNHSLTLSHALTHSLTRPLNYHYMAFESGGLVPAYPPSRSSFRAATFPRRAATFIQHGLLRKRHGNCDSHCHCHYSHYAYAILVPFETTLMSRVY
jgi:hypothetical protein